jgi:predicted RNA binding protein YcfA (HicA-like mRNA interferase family)
MSAMEFAKGTINDKHIRKLVSALETAGLQVTVTKGKQHIRVENPHTHKVVFFGGNSLGDWRAAKNILRDLKQVGFDKDIKLG